MPHHSPWSTPPRKPGLNAFTEAAAAEYGPRGIRVNAIVCGTFHTDSFHHGKTLEVQERMAANVGLHRIANADEIVGTALPRERGVVVPLWRTGRARRRLSSAPQRVLRPGPTSQPSQGRRDGDVVVDARPAVVRTRVGSPHSSARRGRCLYWLMSSLIWLTLRGLQSNVPFLVGVTRTNLPFSTFVRT